MANVNKTYIHGHAPSVLKAHARRTAARDAAYLLPHILPTHKILDVGCGPGTISADLAQLVPQGGIACLDLSETAVASARQTFAERNLIASPSPDSDSNPKAKVEFAVGDVTTRLPFPDETFDIVHAHMVLIHLPDPIKALREMRRVLKSDGGLLACKDMIMSTVVWYPHDERLGVWERGITGTIADTGADPLMGRRLKGAALEAGFGGGGEGKIVARASCWSFTELDEVRFWGESCACRLEEGSGGGLRERVIKGGYSTEGEVDGFVTACREWVAKEGAWFGVMNGELLAWK